MNAPLTARDIAPDFIALIEKHYGHAKQDVKLRALCTLDGHELGKVDDPMRADLERIRREG
jgi:hypothetical protein